MLLKQIHGGRWTESDAIGNVVSLAACNFHLSQGRTGTGFIAPFLWLLAPCHDCSVLNTCATNILGIRFTDD